MDFEIATEILKSGVVTEIFKKVCELTGEGYDKLEAKIANACHQYDKNYRDRHGKLKVSCVDMRKPIPLDDVYVAIQFLNQHTVLRYRSSEDIEQAFRERSRRHFDLTSDERQNGTQAANDEQYLMLLGGPGIGKSTFLRKVGLEALKGKNGNFEHQCIPVFLELKRFNEDQIDIEALITREFEICGYPYPAQMTNAALTSGKLLILFDGLDEVPTSNVNNVIHKIGDFVDQYRENRFIASCRIAAYKGGFTRFAEVEMADFDDVQIQTYIKNWFDSTPDEYRRQLHDDMGTANRCWEMLNASEHSATKELARNPLLLTLLCTVYDRSQTLSRNRANLYEKALNVFLEEWAAEKLVFFQL
ncbi:MAG: NACHT domain-containing protein [Candidatus Poribacteria bacterium]|nr:NACHT domain-containing protein [Candidatus Poribacteria bacterium]